MFEYDNRLLAAVAVKPRVIGEVIQILEKIDGICVDQDGLKWFNSLYLRITRQVSPGKYQDPAWLMALDVRFAQFYLDALAGWLSHGEVAECWRVLVARREQGRIARVQFALAGVNAHINHDLCAAIVATCEATGTTPVHGGMHYQDYTALNTILSAQVDAAKQELMVRLLGDALPPVSHLEETLASWSVTAAREKAWLNAQYLWHLPALRGTVLEAIDGFTAVIGKTLLVPVP